MSSAPDTFATRVYVIGEVTVSIVALAGSMAVLFYSADEGVKLTASGVLSAIVVFWFSRRQAEQSNTALASIANGKLTELLDAQRQAVRNSDALVTLMAAAERRAGGVAAPPPPP
jgi:hypothetical protein